MGLNYPDQNYQDTQPVRKGSRFAKFLLEVFQTVVLALILYFLIDSVIARVRVENVSMQPTLQAGDFLLVNKLAYRFGDIQQGDIVIFHYPNNLQEDYIKRVIGVPGDQIRIDQGQVFVNEHLREEPYIADKPSYSGEWIVPEEALFVLGDNRNQSSDSHSWGYVPSSNVVGKAIVVYWPITEFKVLNQSSVVSAKK